MKIKWPWLKKSPEIKECTSTACTVEGVHNYMSSIKELEIEEEVLARRYYYLRKIKESILFNLRHFYTAERVREENINDLNTIIFLDEIDIGKVTIIDLCKRHNISIEPSAYGNSLEIIEEGF